MREPRKPQGCTIVHVSIIELEGTRTDYHTVRVDAGSLLGELVELHELVPWGRPGSAFRDLYHYKEPSEC